VLILGATNCFASTQFVAPRSATEGAALEHNPVVLVRRGLVWFFRRVVGIYFRSIESAGLAPAADTAGRLFVSNHVNGLIDPILVLTAARCPISPVAKSTLWKVPVLRWLLAAVEAVPIVRRRDDPTKIEGSNDETFERVAAWLAGGGNILIFPEGTSHNEPHVVAVRSGGARMLLRAHRRGEGAVSFQAVALEFDSRHEFRSRALLVYGPVRRAEDYVAEDDDASVAAITAAIRDDLSELVVEGATWPERVLIARVAEMIVHDGGERSLVQWNEIGRQVEAARKTLARLDESQVARVAEVVDAYHALLDREGLDDADVAGAEPPRLREALGTLLLAPLALVGTILYWLPYQAPRLAARMTKDVDIVSTYKLGMGLVVHPLWAALLVAAAWWRLPLGAAIAATATVVVTPFIALGVGERVPRLVGTLRLGSTRHAELREARAAAMARIRQTQELIGQAADVP
jgi:glycerol-3-phosphate O-acyltransferase/dihydroxyacetone phosphate acyltransferase